jgi:hypothetical protein
MQWARLNNPSQKEWKEFLEEFEKSYGFKYTRKPRYLVDESLGIGTTELLKNWNCNVTDVWELGLNGHSDENIWKAAQKDKRIILTHDDDFLDNRMFPLIHCFGVVIFPHKDGGESSLISKLKRFTDLMCSGMGFTYEKKIVISGDNHWRIIRLDKSSKLEEDIYNLTDSNFVSQLSEENT